MRQHASGVFAEAERIRKTKNCLWMRLEACTSLEICDASTAEPSPLGQRLLRQANGCSVATQQSGKRGGLVDLHADDGF